MFIFKNLLHFFIPIQVILSILFSGYDLINNSFFSTIIHRNCKALDDQLCPIKFDFNNNNTTEISIFTTGIKRRNIFKDIKSAIKYRDEAQKSIEASNATINKIKSKHNSYSILIMKQADECLYNAREAFKNFSYFKAIDLARKGMEHANDSIPRNYNCQHSMTHFYYKKYIINKDKVIAKIVVVNTDQNFKKSMNVAIGDIITSKLDTPVHVEMNNGKILVIKNIEYLIENITSNEICIRNITANLPSFNIPLNKKSFIK